MKIILIYLKAIFFSINLIFSQTSSTEFDPFQAGENLEYRVHYGIFNASYASLTLTNDKVNGEDVLLASGYGKTIGLARLFFKVEDYYISYFESKKVQPKRFKRNIYEGGYTKNLEVSFNSEKKEATVKNIKKGTTDVISTKDNVQDLISSLYYLRKNFSEDYINEGDFFPCIL